MGPRGFFEEVREAHAKAVDRIGSIDLPLDIAGKAVTISFASEDLSEQLTPALAHRTRTETAANPVFRLLAFDSTSSGVTPPSPPWGPNDYRQKGRIRGFNRDGIRTAFHIGDVNVLSMFDEESGVGLFWTADGRRLPSQHIGSPFLIVLQWWAESQGLTLVHAGAVGTSDGGVLLAGAGGSGKSTTALACVDAPGFHYVSDDYCLLETEDGDRAHSIFSSGKLDDHSLALLPHLGPMASNKDRPAGEKAVIFLSHSKPEALASSLPVRAILLPRPAGSGATTYRPASPANALRALAPSTIFQLTGAGNRAFSEMASLVRRLPSFELCLSEHMRDSPSTVASIIEALA